MVDMVVEVEEVLVALFDDGDHFGQIGWYDTWIGSCFSLNRDWQ